MIKQYQLRVLNENFTYPITVYATDVTVSNGIVIFYIDTDIQFACTATMCVFKLCPDKKNPIRKVSAILSNSLIKI